MPNSTEDEFKLFKQVLVALCKNYRGHAGAGLSEELSRNLNFWQGIWSPLDKNKILSLTIRARHSLDSLQNASAQFLYLKPFQSRGKNVVPVMTFMCRIKNGIVEASIRLVLIFEVENGYKAMGYRYETGNGKHAYCHVQHITEIDHAHKLPTEDWIHEEVPAIPIDAGGPVGLLMCILGSLYGKDYVEELTLGDADKRKVKVSSETMRRSFHAI